MHFRVLDLPHKIISLMFRSAQNIFNKRVNHVVKKKYDGDGEKLIIDTNQGRIEQELPNQTVSLLEQIPFSPEEKLWDQLKLSESNAAEVYIQVDTELPTSPNSQTLLNDSLEWAKQPFPYQVDFLDKDATAILDGLTMSGFFTDKFKSTFAGQLLDGATWAGVGHSVGMAIGAQLGRPSKQVVALLGDGGLGISGFDIETAARYNLPICYIVYNNSSWLSPFTQKAIMPDAKDSWGMLPNIRYDKMFAETGCHTEFVTQPQEIKPALERSFNLGKTSVLNVIPDDRVLPAMQQVRIDYYRELAER